jgi:hypothetical protein
MFRDSVSPIQQIHLVGLIKTNQFMLHKEIITVCSDIHTKHINTLCGEKVELLDVKPGGT